jgi:hypothetical protein
MMSFSERQTKFHHSSRRILSYLLVCLFMWFAVTQSAIAGRLSDRLLQFPDWQTKPLVSPAWGDLYYPGWIAGTWQVNSQLVEQIAPLAPDVITPGFEGNQRYLNNPISFQVRFVPATTSSKQSLGKGPLPPLPITTHQPSAIVADRAFNGLSLAKVYLGDQAIRSVTVDPASPNRQVTRLSDDRELISVISGRATEQANDNDFITTEVFQQVFRGSTLPYLNQVETTTAYHYQPEANQPIVADQVTAIYLSPQDPNYFKTGDRPVALYRYRLEFTPSQ